MRRWLLLPVLVLSLLRLGGAQSAAPVPASPDSSRPRFIPTRPTRTSPIAQPTSTRPTTVTRPAPTAAPVDPLGYTLVYEYTQPTNPSTAKRLADQQTTAFPGGIEHEIKWGENPTTIAKDHSASFRETGETVRLVDLILKANPGLDPKKIQPGQKLRVPTMPIIQGDPKASRAIVYTRNKLASASSGFKSLVVGGGAPAGASATKFNRTVIMNVTREEAEAAYRNPPPGVRISTAGGPYVAKLDAGASSTSAAPPQLLTETEKNDLKRLSDRPSTREVWLFILDTGWLDKECRTESLKATYKMLDECWTSLGLYYTHARLEPEDPCPKLVNPHASQIAEAIADLVKCDRGKHVKVVYLPIGVTQGAEPLLIELATLGLYLTGLNSGQSNETEGAHDMLKAARQVAEAAVPKMTKINTSNSISIHQAIFFGLTAAFSQYADRAKARKPLAFFNCSWVIPDNKKIPLDVRGKFPGVIVAAAGNEGPNDRDFVNSRDDFASQVAENDRVVTVMNVHADGLDPKSSWTARDPAIKRKLVGYEGRVRDGVNGTSFAAPRVAWFLAFAETVRHPNGDIVDWLDSHNDWVRNAREQPAPNSLLRFLPVTYLNEAAKL